MYKKSLTMGMVIPLAAAGVVAAAPTASASHHRSDRVVKASGDCDSRADDLTLKATVDRRDITLEVELETNWRRADDKWVVHIKRVRPNEHIYSSGRLDRADFDGWGRHKTFTHEESVDNEKGTDRFKATAVNKKKDQKCVVYLSIGHRGKGGGRH